MNNRTNKLKLLDEIFNQSNTDSLKSLSRGNFPKVLIYDDQQGKGVLFSGRLNASLPKPYQDVILDDKALNTMLVSGGNPITFLLPDNKRN